jgi:hypothetical protein
MDPTTELDSNPSRPINRSHDESGMIDMGGQDHRRFAGADTRLQDHVSGAVPAHSHILATRRPSLNPLDYPVLVAGDGRQGGQLG